MFVEKPLSVLPPEELSPYVDALEEAQREKGLVLSVGYMFRYVGQRQTQDLIHLSQHIRVALPSQFITVVRGMT